MKSYVITTGTVFGLLTLVHVWRMFVEGPHRVHDPFFLALTALTACLSVWAVFVLRAPGSS